MIHIYQREYSNGYQYIVSEMYNQVRVEHYCTLPSPAVGEYKGEAPLPCPNYHMYSRELTELELIQRVYNKVMGINYR